MQACQDAQMQTVLGVDGRRGGWVVATVDVTDAAQLVSLEFHESLAFMEPDGDPPLCVAIDMPIGLADGPRACDIAARKLLSPHTSRVFPAPPRVALGHSDDYEAACRAAKAVSGKALSRQTWNLLTSIRAVDDHADTEGLVECHPEVAFALMQGFALDERKKTPPGRERRLELLRRWLPDLGEPTFGDDGLDALACAWSASRMAEGRALILPAGKVPLDALGRPMRIVA